MRRAAIPFFLTAGLVFAGDRITKWIVEKEMVLNQDISVVGEWIKLHYILNAGAAFGLFQGNRWPLVTVSIIASLGVTWLALSRARGLSHVLPLGLILGGALGNLVDRLATGLVIDFLDVGIGTHRWPVFNVADSAVTVGVIWLALAMRESPDEGVDSEGTGDGETLEGEGVSRETTS